MKHEKTSKTFQMEVLSLHRKLCSTSWLERNFVFWLTSASPSSSDTLHYYQKRHRAPLVVFSWRVCGGHHDGMWSCHSRGPSIRSGRLLWLIVQTSARGVDRRWPSEGMDAKGSSALALRLRTGGRSPGSAAEAKMRLWGKGGGASRVGG